MEVRLKEGKKGPGDSWRWPGWGPSHGQEKWMDGRHAQEVQSEQHGGRQAGEEKGGVQQVVDSTLSWAGTGQVSLGPLSWGSQWSSIWGTSASVHLLSTISHIILQWEIFISWAIGGEKWKKLENFTNDKWSETEHEALFFFLSKDKYKRELSTCFRCAFKPSCVAFSRALTVKLSGSSLSRIWDSFNSDSSFFLMKDSTWCSVVPLFCKELSNENYFP